MPSMKSDNKGSEKTIGKTVRNILYIDLMYTNQYLRIHAYQIIRLFFAVSLSSFYMITDY